MYVYTSSFGHPQYVPDLSSLQLESQTGPYSNRSLWTVIEAQPLQAGTQGDDDDGGVHTKERKLQKSATISDITAGFGTDTRFGRANSKKWKLSTTPSWILNNSPSSGRAMSTNTSVGRRMLWKSKRRILKVLDGSSTSDRASRVNRYGFGRTMSRKDTKVCGRLESL